MPHFITAYEIWWIMRDAIVVKKSISCNGTITMDEVQQWTDVSGHPSNTLYIRAECLGHGHAKAWTQPFWIKEND